MDRPSVEPAHLLHLQHAHAHAAMDYGHQLARLQFTDMRAAALGCVNTIPLLGHPGHLMFPFAGGLNPHFVGPHGPAPPLRVAASAAPAAPAPAPSPAPALVPPPAPAPAPPPAPECTFNYLHSKAVGARGKVNVQEKPFSRVAWVEIQSPPPLICERCTSTLQKHFKNSTTSKKLCCEFLKFVSKVRCRVCLEWCSAETARQSGDFLCAIHATGGDHKLRRVAVAARGRQEVTTMRAAGSSPGCTDNALVLLEPAGGGDGASADGLDAQQALSSKENRGGTVLPYDRRLLHWNADWTMNTEQTYCYCGQNKPQPSLQCSLCKNWYHRDCTSDAVPTNDSSRFLPFQLNYDFTCAVCSSSNRERYELITCSWIDSVLGAMGNMMWETQREFFKVVEVADHLEKHWDILCYRRERKRNWRSPLNSYFTNNKEKLRQQKPYWGIADPHGDGRGPILQPCRVLRGPARPPPEKAVRAAAMSEAERRNSEWAAKHQSGPPPPLFNALNAVAAQLLLEADKLATRQLVPPAYTQELPIAPAGVQQMPTAPAALLCAPTVKPELQAEPAVKRQLPADDREPQMSGVDPPTKRSRPQAEALPTSHLQESDDSQVGAL